MSGQRHNQPINTTTSERPNFDNNRGCGGKVFLTGFHQKGNRSKAVPIHRYNDVGAGFINGIEYEKQKFRS